MSGKKSRIRSPIFAGTLLAVLAMSSGLALADDDRNGDGYNHASRNGIEHGKGLNGGSKGSSGGPVAVPEIDVGAGGNALALLIGGVLLAGERVRSRRKR